eukprot:9503097-Pyramimonas_sp.AAC.1
MSVVRRSYTTNRYDQVVKKDQCSSTLLEAVWGSIVESWGSCIFGVRLERDDTQRALVKHFLWADNVVLVLTSVNQVKQMVSMMTVALRRAGMGWKIESLEYLVFGSRHNQGPQSAGDPVLPQELCGAVILPRRDDCEILGVKFVTNPQGFHAVRHRVGAGRRCFHADSKFYRARAVSMRE